MKSGMQSFWQQWNGCDLKMKGMFHLLFMLFFWSPWYIITCRSFRGRTFYLFSTTPLSAIVKCDIFWKKCLLYKEDLKDVISKKIVHILLHLYDMACFAGETLSQLNLNKENLILYSHSDALPRGYAEMKFRR